MWSYGILNSNYLPALRFCFLKPLLPLCNKVKLILAPKSGRLNQQIHIMWGLALANKDLPLPI